MNWHRALVISGWCAPQRRAANCRRSSERRSGPEGDDEDGARISSPRRLPLGTSGMGEPVGPDWGFSECLVLTDGRALTEKKGAIPAFGQMRCVSCEAGDLRFDRARFPGLLVDPGWPEDMSGNCPIAGLHRPRIQQSACRQNARPLLPGQRVFRWAASEKVFPQSPRGDDACAPMLIQRQQNAQYAP